MTKRTDSSDAEVLCETNHGPVVVDGYQFLYPSGPASGLIIDRAGEYVAIYAQLDGVEFQYLMHPAIAARLGLHLSAVASVLLSEEQDAKRMQLVCSGKLVN